MILFILKTTDFDGKDGDVRQDNLNCTQPCQQRIKRMPGSSSRDLLSTKNAVTFEQGWKRDRNDLGNQKVTLKKLVDIFMIWQILVC